MATISIIGLGYIGMPTGILFAKAGHTVQGYDVNEEVVKSLDAGKLHIKEPGLQELLNEVHAEESFTASTTLMPADVFIICVPTPFREDKTPDLSYVEAASKAVASVVQPGNLVILESTVPVNTTRDTVGRILIEEGHEDVLVAHCPETVLPGNMIQELVHNHRVIGGVTPEATTAAVDLYKTVVEADIHETDAATAEYVKLIENTYRDVNIALANELNMIGRELGVNAREAIKLANLHPRVNIHAPGPGVGGHCIPVDPWFLIKAVKEAPLLSMARTVNDEMPKHVANEICKIVKGINNPTVLLLGTSYKMGIEDNRNSPTYAVEKYLIYAGINVLMNQSFSEFMTKTPNGLHSLNAISLIVLMNDQNEISRISETFGKSGQTLPVLDATATLETGSSAARL